MRSEKGKGGSTASRRHGRGLGPSRGRVGPIGMSESPPVSRIAGWQGSARNLGKRCGVEAAVADYLGGGGTISAAGVIRRTPLIPARTEEVMRQEEPGRGGPIRPLDWRKDLPFEAAAASDRLGWAGLEAAHYRAAPAAEVNSPALTHHRLVLVARPPEELDL